MRAMPLFAMDRICQRHEKRFRQYKNNYYFAMNIALCSGFYLDNILPVHRMPHSRMRRTLHENKQIGYTYTSTLDFV